jgi:hypothetical protein
MYDTTVSNTHQHAQTASDLARADVLARFGFKVWEVTSVPIDTHTHTSGQEMQIQNKPIANPRKPNMDTITRATQTISAVTEQHGCGGSGFSCVTNKGVAV